MLSRLGSIFLPTRKKVYGLFLLGAAALVSSTVCNISEKHRQEQVMKKKWKEANIEPSTPLYNLNRYTAVIEGREPPMAPLSVYYVQRASCNIQLLMTDDAMQDFHMAIQIDPKQCAKAATARAIPKLLAKKGHYPEATEVWETLIGAAPDGEEQGNYVRDYVHFLQTGGNEIRNPARALEVMECYMRGAKDRKPDDHLTFAGMLADKEKWNEAVEQCKQAIARATEERETTERMLQARIESIKKSRGDRQAPVPPKGRRVPAPGVAFVESSLEKSREAHRKRMELMEERLNMYAKQREPALPTRD